MKSFLWLLAFLFIYLIVAESQAEACGRSGRGGIFAGRKPVRTFISNHRIFRR